MLGEPSTALAPVPYFQNRFWIEPTDFSGGLYHQGIIAYESTNNSKIIIQKNYRNKIKEGKKN
ncbi:hypothetical protein NIES592_01475 [Fischerella major NIES-592]|uniref:Uncharacterized protein n=1 Tax=Fischerella major NIES-592 TaxID=210994 RepID=A0A1U7H4W6_9CYAN|nr:hypothetical protein NIES592_01475 [Fischerella major NIES-592]